MTRSTRRVGTTRVSLRTQRRQILSWTIPLLALLAVVAPSYASTYPKLEQRQHLISNLGANAATRLLYGPLPEPGTIGQLVAWEMGTYLIIVSSVMALLLAVKLGRGAEDTGRAELVQACGHSAAARLRGALLAMTTVAIGLGVAVGGILALESSFESELTVSGSIGLGLVTACCSWFFGLVGLLAGEVADSAGLARMIGFIVLAAAFGIRAIANVQDIAPLRWVSPLGWIDVVAPYTHDRLWTAVIFVVVCAVVAGATWLAGSGREYAAAAMHSRATSDDRLPVRSVWQLTWHLERKRWIGWASIVTAIAALFGGMSGSLVGLLKDDESTAKLMRELTGQHRLDAVFFSFAGVMLGLLVGCYAVSTVLSDGAAEADGTLENLPACGVPRRTPLLAQVGVAAVGSLAMLLVAGCVGGLIAAAHQSSALGRCLGYVVGQLPAVLALIGITASIIGLHRRWGPAAWAPVAASGALVLMGSVLSAPHWLQVAGVFAHAPDYADGSGPSTGVFVLLACFVAAAAVGVWRRTQRDVEPN